jgi:hypothetical protein
MVRPVAADPLDAEERRPEDNRVFFPAPGIEVEVAVCNPVTVENDTARWYRYIDMTPQAESLFRS